MPTNKERAEFFGRLLPYHADIVGEIGEPVETLIVDLLANAMHYCDESDPHVSFDDCLRMARIHHYEEAMEEPHDMTCDEIKAATPLPKFASPLVPKEKPCE